MLSSYNMEHYTVFIAGYIHSGNLQMLLTLQTCKFKLQSCFKNRPSMYSLDDLQPAAEVAIFQNTRSRSNQETQTVRYECSKCDSLFTTRLFLHQHEATIHNRIFHCPFCPALFSNKPDFRVHVNAHLEKKYLPCSLCKKIFYDVAEYTTHVKLHREPFLYNCDKCPAMFAQLSKLRTHYAVHITKKFIHTIPKLSKHIFCPYQNQRKGHLNNRICNNGTTGGPATSNFAACQTETVFSSVQSVQEASEPAAYFSGSNRKENGDKILDNISFMADKKCKKKASEKELCPTNKNTTEETTETDFRRLLEDDIEVISATQKQTSSDSKVNSIVQTRSRGRPRKYRKDQKVTKIEANRLSEDNVEIISAPKTQKQIPSSSKDEHIKRTRRRPQKYNSEKITSAARTLSVDETEVTSILKKQVSSTLHDKEVEVIAVRKTRSSSSKNYYIAPQTGRCDSSKCNEASEKNSQADEGQLKKKDNCEKIFVTRKRKVVEENSTASKSIISAPLDLSNNANSTKSRFSLKNARTIEYTKDQTEKSLTKEILAVYTQTSAAPTKNVLSDVSKKRSISTLNNASVKSMTILESVIPSETSHDHGNEVNFSTRKTSTINYLERAKCANNGPLYGQNFGEITIAPSHIDFESSNKEVSVMAVENNVSVYTFNEENSNKKTSSTKAATECFSTKRRRTELWKFFLTASKSPMKKAKKMMPTKKRRSIHFYKCSSCTRVFPTLGLLTRHELLHLKKTGLLCTECGGVFARRGNLHVHKKLAHSQPS